jgi:DMSO/TMAO reductase YedYZ molybdopterin-dependent catalytic subunit
VSGAATPGPERSKPDRGGPAGGLRAAVAGAVAAGVAVGASQLAATVSHRLPSLVGSVGDQVINLAPRWLVQAGISNFGRNDKRVLVSAITVLAVALGALFAVTGRKRPGIAFAGFVAFATLAGAAAAARPDVSAAAAVAAALVAGAGGVVTLFVLGRLAAGAAAEGDGADAGRRAFLGAAGGLAAAAALAGAAGSLIGRGARAAAARARIVLPRAARGAPAVPAGATFDDIAGLTPLITSNRAFYRIDTALSAPDVDPAGWRLRITGMVAQPVTLTYGELLAMPLTERHVTIGCVSNEVGGNLVGTARWLGVELASLLALAVPAPGATQVVGRSVDGFTAGFPIALAGDGRSALIAVGMNGEALPLAHGFPARLVVAGLYGYASATKWLKEIELTTLEGFEGYWVQRGWSKVAPIKTESRIDAPRPDAALTAGPVTVAGVAWAPTRGVGLVEVRVDGGPWQPADLAESIGDETWRQWRWQWPATPGRHLLQVRAADRAATFQDSADEPPFPSGATGYHGVAVSVRAA